MKHLILFVLAVTTLTIPITASAASVAKSPKILSAGTVVLGSSVVAFSHPQFAGKRVKVYAYLRYNGKSEDSTGIVVKDQQFFTQLDRSGAGSIRLSGLKDGKTYRVSLVLKRLEPSVQWTTQSEWKKLHTTR